MKQDDVAEPQEKRDHGHSIASRKKGSRSARLPAELLASGPKISDGKTTLERLVGWLSPGDHKLTVAGVRTELMAKGFDLTNGIEPMAACPHVVDMLLKTLYTSTLDIKRDKARAAAAAADTAEIELEKLRGNLVTRDEVRRVMENGIVTFRERVRNLADLTLEQKKAVCELLVNLKLDDDATGS